MQPKEAEQTPRDLVLLEEVKVPMKPDKHVRTGKQKA